MRIFFDHQIFSLQEFGGISRYFYEIVVNLEKRGIDISLPMKYSNNYYLMNSFSEKYSYFLKDKKFAAKNKTIFLFNSIISKGVVKKKDFDIFHPTYYYPNFLDNIGRKPFVLTVFDMIHERYPEYLANRKLVDWKKILSQKATKIIAISENTKKDIMHFYGIEEEKIEVIYLGNSLNVHTNNVLKDLAMKIPSKYILFVGSRGGYKNFAFFVKSISPIIHDNDDLFLVCAGGGNFSNIERVLFCELGINNKIIHFSVDDQGLVQLYKNAILFVFPSLYEGFGIPILESLACGCPLILSDTSSFPEVAGNSAIYFNPQEEGSIKNAVEKVIYNKSLRNDMILKGYNQVKKFSWEKATNETVDLYRSVL